MGGKRRTPKPCHETKRPQRPAGKLTGKEPLLGSLTMSDKAGGHDMKRPLHSTSTRDLLAELDRIVEGAETSEMDRPAVSEAKSERSEENSDKTSTLSDLKEQFREEFLPHSTRSLIEKFPELAEKAISTEVRIIDEATTVGEIFDRRRLIRKVYSLERWGRLNGLYDRVHGVTVSLSRSGALEQLQKLIKDVPPRKLRKLTVGVRMKSETVHLTEKERRAWSGRMRSRYREIVTGWYYPNRVQGLGYGEGPPVPRTKLVEIKPEEAPYTRTERCPELKLKRRWTAGRVSRYLVGATIVIWTIAKVV